MLPLRLPSQPGTSRAGSVDLKGELTLTLEGGATLTPEGLRFDGKNAMATSTPLKRSLRSKTIEVWVRLEGLSQRGGGVMTIESSRRSEVRIDRVRRKRARPLDGRQREIPSIPERVRNGRARRRRTGRFTLRSLTGQTARFGSTVMGCLTASRLQDSARRSSSRPGGR